MEISENGKMKKNLLMQANMKNKLFLMYKFSKIYLILI